MKKLQSFNFYKHFSSGSSSDKKNDVSSETIRETTFQFDLFQKNLPQQKRKINRVFLEWFIGFAEGDGSIIVSQLKSGQVRLFFTLVQKEVEVLEKIQSTLGFGNVQKHGTCFRYSVTDAEGIDRLIHLFNGNLVLNKFRKRFHSWLHARNEIRSSAEPIIEKEHLPDIKFLSSGWLSGFTDAEGCFNLQKTKNPNGSFYASCRFVLVQKDEHEVLKKINKAIGHGYLCYYEDNSVTRYFLIKSEGLDLLLDYFKKFPLRTNKNISKVRLEKMLNYKKTRKEVPWEGKVLKRVLKLLKKKKS